MIVKIAAVQVVLQRFAVERLKGHPVKCDAERQNLDDFVVEVLIELLQFEIIVVQIDLADAVEIYLGGEQILLKNVLTGLDILFQEIVVGKSKNRPLVNVCKCSCHFITSFRSRKLAAESLFEVLDLF